MDTRLRKGFILLFVIFLFTIFELLYLRIHFLTYLSSISTAFIMLVAVVAFLLFGIRKDKMNIFKQNCIYNVFIIMLLYFIVYYFSGLFFGFLRNSYSLSFLSIISNIIVPLLFLIFIEVLRYILVLSTKETKMMIVSSSVILSIFEVVTFYNLFDASLVGLFKLTTLSLLPVFAKNMLCGYFNAYITIRLSLFYRIIFDLYIYIVPIFPDCGDYMKCVLGLLLPYVIYYSVSKNLFSYRHIVKSNIVNVTKKSTKMGDMVFLFILIIFVCLISCMFPLFLMSVGSNSMSPVLKKGDAIFAYKVNDAEKIKKGDIIVFDSNNTTIIHRVDSIIKENGSISFETKGDANNSKDNDIIQINNIKGKVFSKIPFIGYPSVLLSKLLNFKS